MVNVRKVCFMVGLCLTVCLALIAVGSGAKNKAGSDGRFTNQVQAAFGISGGLLAVFVCFYGILAGFLFREIHLPSFSMLGSAAVWLLSSSAGTLVYLIAVNDSWMALDLQFASNVAASVVMFISISISFGASKSYVFLQQQKQSNKNSLFFFYLFFFLSFFFLFLFSFLFLFLFFFFFFRFFFFSNRYETTDDEEIQSFRTGSIEKRISAVKINYFLLPLSILNALECITALALAAALMASDSTGSSLVLISGSVTIAAAALGILVAISTIVCRMRD